MRTIFYIYTLLMVLTVSDLSFAQTPAPSVRHNEDKFVDATRAVDTSTARQGTITVKVEDGREVRYFQSGDESFKITQCLESCQADLFKCTNGSECEIRAEFDKGNTIRVRELSEIRNTKTGAKFTRVRMEELKKLGVTDVEACVGKNNEHGAWAEPDYENEKGVVVKGKIWCGAISPKTMNHADAKSYCEDKGMQLPSGYIEEQNGKNNFPNEDSDWVRFRKNSGAESVKVYEVPKGYTSDVLPNMSGHWFWSESVLPDYSNFAYFFSGRRGAINYYNCDYANFVSARCVVARR